MAMDEKNAVFKHKHYACAMLHMYILQITLKKMKYK